MDLNARQAAAGNGVPDRDAGVGISGGIDQDPREFIFSLADQVANLAFMIGLDDGNLDSGGPLIGVSPRLMVSGVIGGSGRCAPGAIASKPINMVSNVKSS